jgi:hypothetical protein
MNGFPISYQLRLVRYGEGIHMFELVYQQASVFAPIKSFYPTLGGAYLAAKSVRKSGAYKLEILSPAGKSILAWK